MPKTGLDSSWESEVEQNLLSAPDQLGDSLEVIFLNRFADVYFPYVIGITPHCTSHFLIPTLPPSRLSLLSDDDGLWSCELARSVKPGFKFAVVCAYVSSVVVGCSCVCLVLSILAKYWSKGCVFCTSQEMSGKIVSEMSYEISC